MRRGLILAAALLSACGQESSSGQEHPARVRERLERAMPRDRGVEALPQQEAPSWAKVAPEQLEAAGDAGVPVAFENSLGMRFVLIPPGTFTMGSPGTEAGRKDDEAQHEVTLTRPYYIGVTEVTNGQYGRFKPDHSSGKPGERSIDADNQPVVWVSWDDAVAFAAWLSAQNRDRTYRLPTEAEWERACRAGTSTPFWWGTLATTDEANYDGNFGYAGGAKGEHRQATVPVGTLPANPWGLREVHGNVSEWCADWHGAYPSGPVTDPAGAKAGEGHVLRGGHWDAAPAFVRAAHRGVGYTEQNYLTRGFRLALRSHEVVPPTPSSPAMARRARPRSEGPRSTRDHPEDLLPCENLQCPSRSQSAGRLERQVLQPADLKNVARARPPAWNLLLATAYLVGAGGAVYAGIRQIGEREAGFSDLLTHHLPMALYGAALAWGVLRLRLAPDGGGFGGMLLATLHAGSLGAGGLAHIWMALGWPGWPASRGSDWIVFSTFPDYALFAALGAALWGPVPGSAIVLRAHRGDVYFGVTLLGMAWILLVALV